MDELNIELKKPFDYALKGDTHQASFITLRAPTFKQIQHVAPMKQVVMSAVLHMEERDLKAEENPNDDKGISSDAIMQLLYASDQNVAGVFVHAQELFRSGAALVDGEASLTVPLMEKMDPNDFERLTGEYIARFLAPSLTAGG